MIPVFILLLILFFLLTVHRMASTLFELTGLSRDASRLQALSALTGTGFTTKESELIIDHPVRRRVAMLLMLVGNTGIVTAMASVVAGFLELRDTTNSAAVIGGTALAGSVLLLVLAYSRWFNHSLERVVVRMSQRWQVAHVLDYAELLQVGQGFSVCTRSVQASDWIAGKTLADTRLRAEGIIVLGVFREEGVFEGTPNGSTELLAGDRVVVYGRESDIQRVANRVAGWWGDHDHEVAVEAHRIGDTPTTGESEDPIPEPAGSEYL